MRLFCCCVHLSEYLNTSFLSSPPVCISLPIHHLTPNPTHIHTLPCRSKLQADALAPGKNKYAGITDCFRQTIAQGGTRALFNGLGFTLVRAVPVASVILPTYDWAFYNLSVLWGIEQPLGEEA